MLCTIFLTCPSHNDQVFADEGLSCKNIKDQTHDNVV